ncbi:MAG TPA: HNH endonuclease signature motif containing protein [Streptosporangiaceae bacterium]|nr:HNH endonuclease signature motif containing protein [Streptosporangiaceae bacterium]
MTGASVFEQEWRDWAAGEWAAHRGAATILGHDGAVWLDGTTAEAAGCDAMTIPVVFGTIDWQALDHLVDQCVELHRIRHGSAGDQDAQDGTDAREAREAELRDSILGTILDVVSGPGAAASVLRTGLLGGNQLGSPSQVLDIGFSEEIPAAIRRAVTLRDRHCAFGKCTMLPQFCEVHHIVHKEDGGPTCVSNCVLLCWFHHQVMIHRKGWRIRLLADGTTEAISPTGTVVRSHGPPARAG